MLLQLVFHSWHSLCKSGDSLVYSFRVAPSTSYDTYSRRPRRDDEERLIGDDDKSDADADETDGALDTIKGNKCHHFFVHSYFRSDNMCAATKFGTCTHHK